MNNRYSSMNWNDFVNHYPTAAYRLIDFAPNCKGHSVTIIEDLEPGRYRGVKIAAAGGSVDASVILNPEKIQKNA